MITDDAIMMMHIIKNVFSISTPYHLNCHLYYSKSYKHFRKHIHTGIIFQGLTNQMQIVIKTGIEIQTYLNKHKTYEFVELELGK